MKTPSFRILLLFLMIFAGMKLFASVTPSDTTTLFDEKAQKYINQHFEGQWFLGYQYSDLDNGEINKFTLKRSYITFKHKFNERLDVRFTQDITIDREGEDAGNIETRLKYCYLNVNLDDIGIITNGFVEVGLVHRPWLDFEQKVNPYRVQGRMFLERVGLFNSADFGVTFGGLLGGKMDETYRKNVSSSYPGKYGSFAVGVYNGAGYHALEKNENKTMESRLTLRPFPENLPGLQISYNMLYGKGNVHTNPEFIVNSGFLSYETRNLILSAQYYKGMGNSKGTYADSLGNAYQNNGYSFFSELRIPNTKIAFFGRYDNFSSENSVLDHQRYIGGISYYFYKSSKFIINLDYYDPKTPGMKAQAIIEAFIEIKF